MPVAGAAVEDAAAADVVDVVDSALLVFLNAGLKASRASANGSACTEDAIQTLVR